MNNWFRKALFLIPSLCLLLISCGHSSRLKTLNNDQRHGKIQVLSTTAMIGDLVKKVGGEFIHHTTLIVGEVDPHSYELVKGDDEKIDFADIVFYNGLGLEHGASLQYRMQQHNHSVGLGNHLYRQMQERFLMVDEQIDPHIWMDVSFWKEIVPIIAKELTQVDPDHAEIYAKNAEQLYGDLARVDHRIYEMMQKIPADKRYLVTSHDAFNYFARRYLAFAHDDWQSRFVAPEGLAPDGQLSTVHLQEIVDHLQRYRIQVLFPESNVNKDSLRKIQIACKEKGMPVRLCAKNLFGDSMGDLQSGATTYVEMMEKNAEIILSELSKD